MLLGKGCGDWVPTLLGGSPWNLTGTNWASDTVLYATNPTAIPVYDRTGENVIGYTWGRLDNSSGGSVKIPTLPGTSDTILVGDFWVDPECEALVWAGANLGTTTAFQARVTVCMELEVDYGASVYRPLVTPPAQMDIAAVEKAEQVMAIMPPSINKAEGSQSWWNALTTGVTGVAELVGDLGVPILSTAANIGLRVAKMLGIN